MRLIYTENQKQQNMSKNHTQTSTTCWHSDERILKYRKSTIICACYVHISVIYLLQTQAQQAFEYGKTNEQKRIRLDCYSWNQIIIIMKREREKRNNNTNTHADRSIRIEIRITHFGSHSYRFWCHMCMYHHYNVKVKTPWTLPYINSHLISVIIIVFIFIIFFSYLNSASKITSNDTQIIGGNYAFCDRFPFKFSTNKPYDRVKPIKSEKKCIIWEYSDLSMKHVIVCC